MHMLEMMFEILEVKIFFLYDILCFASSLSTHLLPGLNCDIMGAGMPLW